MKINKSYEADKSQMTMDSIDDIRIVLNKWKP